MPENNDQPQEVNNLWQLIGLYVNKHGPLTFGVSSMIIMWMVMVTPELQRNQINVDALRALTEQLHQLQIEQQGVVRDQDKISEHLKQTAEILDRITLRQTGGTGQ